jgi:phytoene dehydrogenase-like protein
MLVVHTKKLKKLRVESSKDATLNAHLFYLLSSPFSTTHEPQGTSTRCGAIAMCPTVDMTEAIERQIERFAPGFKDLILERHTRNTSDYETYNPNYVGGDIGGGGFGLKKIMQMGSKRPYSLGGGVFLCSAAAPPGAGVHGMCGYYAARAALD